MAVPAGYSDAAASVARWVRSADDNHTLPFAVVDKRAAVIMVFHGDGSLAGNSTVLLGLTPGDDAAQGVGERAQAGRLRTEDRTTPAGRFMSEPGHNLGGEAVVWIDYGKALAIHRLRPGPSREQRAQRMASPRAVDKRISAGCVVVPEAFYLGVVQPVLGVGRGVVYVMPEGNAWQTPWQQMATASP